MKLRYIAEQRDRARSHLNKKTSRKKEKFNLDSDESEGGDVFIGGFTHKGRPVEDDFDDRISLSSDGETGDKGKLTEEMVNQLNFGKGNEEGEEKKKSRKEIFEEIIEKSKAYKEANKELKFINRELV
jgi:nucleolar protein 14